VGQLTTQHETLSRAV